MQATWSNDEAVRRSLVIGDVLTGNARRFPTKQAIKDQRVNWTWADLNRFVNRVTHWLLDDCGLAKGDRISIVSENRAEFLLMSYAAAKGGLVFAPLNHRLAATEMEIMLRDAEPRLLVHSSGFTQVAERLRDVLGIEIVSLDDEPFEKRFQDVSDAEPDVRVEPDDLRGITFTGGTTGAPKGVMLTHRNLMQMAYGANIEQRLLPSDRHLVIFPMGLISGQTFACWYGYQAPTIVIIERFDPEVVLRTIQEERITTLLLAPTMINALIHLPNAREYDVSSLRYILYGSSPIAAEVLEGAIDLFKCDFMQAYGQTECTGFALYLPMEDHRRGLLPDSVRQRRLRCAGREAFNTETRLVDDQGRDVADGEPGELLIRSEQVMAGYWKRPQETATALRDGWLHTGDVFRRYDDGYLEIVDRAKDMIISGAYNIYPKEVEIVLYQHPAVRDAAVIGIPDSYWGEVVHGVVSLKEGFRVSEAELVEFCKDRIASYKKPRSIEFVNEFPLTAAGKIHKPSLREPYWNSASRRVN